MQRQYVQWVRRFILFHHKRHPLDMGAGEVEAFLSDLTVEGNVVAATQNQALSALLFMYKEVLESGSTNLNSAISGNSGCAAKFKIDNRWGRLDRLPFIFDARAGFLGCHLVFRVTKVAALILRAGNRAGACI